MPSLLRRPVHLVMLAALLLGVAPSAAQAQLLLRGPHPSLKDNELSIRAGYGLGFGDSFSGAKLVADYGYKLDPVAWLDLQITMLDGCSGECAFEGDSFEVLGGVRWKFRTAVPVVPYGALLGGLAYFFPSSARAAIGLTARGVIGADYYFFDWFGVGAHVALSLGHVFYESGIDVSRVHAVLDFGGGPVFQF